jgi:hypothetical protein
MPSIITNILIPIFTSLVCLLIEYGVIQRLFNRSASVGQQAAHKSFGRPLLVFLLFTFVTIVSFWSGTQYSKLNLFGPGITIASPQSGSLVSQSVDIAGTAQNIRQDRDLWVYVKVPLTNAYFLSPITVLPGGNWSVTNQTVGTEVETNNQFIIGVLSVEQKDSAVIRQNVIGVTALPSSTTIHTEIMVVRK